MFLINANIEEAIVEFPLIKEWIDIIKFNIIKDSSFKNSDIKFNYTYGFFVPKSNKYYDYRKILYPERLNIELSKIRTGVTIEMGHFIMTNRLPKGSIPEVIKDLVIEITKVKMILEAEIDYDVDVVDSIPPLHKTTSISVIRDQIKNEDEEFDIDDILDKISKNGIESLSDREKDFLDKKSKDV